MRVMPWLRGARWFARALILVTAVACTVFLQAQAPAKRTVWDGVYTDAQAARATPLFDQSCSNCHSLDAQGNRPLVGDKFWERNTQKTVGDVLTFVKTNMPNG